MLGHEAAVVLVYWINKTKDFSESLPAHALNNFFFREICAHRTFFLHVLYIFCADYTCENYFWLWLCVPILFQCNILLAGSIFFQNYSTPPPSNVKWRTTYIICSTKRSGGGGGGARVAGMQALYPSKLKFKIILSLSLSLPSLKHDDFILV